MIFNLGPVYMEKVNAPGRVISFLPPVMCSRVSSCLHAELLTRLTGVSFSHIMLPSVTRSLGQNSGKKTFLKISSW